MDDFKMWFLENHVREGGLVTQDTAGQLIGMSRQNVQNLIKRDKIEAFDWGKKRFVSLNQILQIEKERKKKKSK